MQKVNAESECTTMMHYTVQGSANGEQVSQVKHVKVRRGCWQQQAAVYKLWDLGDSLDQVPYMHTEVTMYRHLSALQASRHWACYLYKYANTEQDLYSLESYYILSFLQLVYSC